MNQAMMLTKSLSLPSFLNLNLMHMLVIMMMRVTLLDPEFWHIPTWQKPSVSCCSGHLTFSCTCVYLRRPLEERTYPVTIAETINQPDFIHLIQKFIHDQNQPDSDSVASSSTSPDLPEFHAKISVYTSAVATFYAPSDISGIGGMRCERIHAINAWRNGPGRYDCVFVNTDASAELEGMLGLDIARVQLFFSFKHEDTIFPCALVHWFSRVGDSPDRLTGMWIVKPDLAEDGTPSASVIHIDTIFRAAHLMPIYGNEHIPRYLSFTQSLNAFNSYYVNKYIDHHAFEIAF